MSDDIDLSQYEVQKNDMDLSQYEVPDEQENTTRLKPASSIGDALKSALGNMAQNVLSEGIQQSIPSLLRGKFTKGISQGMPHALISSLRGASQLVGKEGFPETQMPSPGSLSQSLGQMLGQGAGYGIAAAPFVAGGEATLPGLLGESIGAGVAGGVTTEGSAKDRLTNALLESMIPGVGRGLNAAGKIGASIIKREPTPRKAADIIQQYHDAAHVHAVEPLEKAKELIVKSDMGPIKIKSSIIDDAFSILGKDEGTKRLVDKARTGDFESLDKLQSDLKREARILIDPKKSHSDRLLGKQANTLANNILDGIKTKAHYKGRADIADLITEGKSRYANFAKLYLENPTVSKLVGKEKIVPKNLISKLESDTAYMDKLKTAIPEISDMIKTKQNKALLKRTYGTLSKLGGAAALSKYLLPGENEKED